MSRGAEHGEGRSAGGEVAARLEANGFKFTADSKRLFQGSPDTRKVPNAENLFMTTDFKTQDQDRASTTTTE